MMGIGTGVNVNSQKLQRRVQSCVASDAYIRPLNCSLLLFCKYIRHFITLTVSDWTVHVDSDGGINT